MADYQVVTGYDENGNPVEIRRKIIDGAGTGVDPRKYGDSQSVGTRRTETNILSVRKRIDFQDGTDPTLVEILPFAYATTGVDPTTVLMVVINASSTNEADDALNSGVIPSSPTLDSGFDIIPVGAGPQIVSLGGEIIKTLDICSGRALSGDAVIPLSVFVKGVGK